jgi:hypothetical protein
MSLLYGPPPSYGKAKKRMFVIWGRGPEDDLSKCVRAVQNIDGNLGTSRK